MALEATHIRFALDLKSDYNVQNIEKFISGSIYPDSRYITGIDRNLTHNNDILLPEFAKNDFRKGWQVHQLCDVLQNEMRKKYLSELLLDHNDKWNEKEWIITSATKIIQDMNDLKCFDLQDNLKYLEYAYNPNEENIEDIKKYNQIIINLYKNKKETTVEDNFQMWLSLGIDREYGEKIRAKTYEFLKNSRLVARIENIYDKMLKNYKKI